jgi:hypothetical protein
LTHRETILSFLGEAGGPICDDCLSSHAGITPRQTINLNCNRMAQRNELARIDAVCHYCRSLKICNHVEAGTPIPPAAPDAVPDTGDTERLWHWEGNVQARLVTWLARDGWSIMSAANTAAKSAGKDIIAERDGRTLWVSVKGFPTGTQKTNPSTQARHWFSHAVFDLVMYRDQSDSAELALGLPDGFATYQNLAERVRWLRTNLPFSIFWVAESGSIRSD